MPFWNAVASANMPKQSAVLILRKNDGKDTRIKINIDDLVSDGDLTQNIELARGDYVIVQEGIF